MKRPYGNNKKGRFELRISPKEKARYTELANNLNANLSRLILAGLFLTENPKMTFEGLCQTCPNCGKPVELDFDIEAHVIYEGVCWNCGKEYLIGADTIESEGETIFKKDDK